MEEKQSGNQDDEFGLPEVRLQPRKPASNSVTGQDHSTQGLPGPVVTTSDSSGTNHPSSNDDSGGGSSSDSVRAESGWEPSGVPRLLYILIPILTILLALKGYFYLHVAPEKVSDLEKTPPTEVVPTEIPAKAEEKEKQQSEPIKPAKPVAVILSEPTGRFHVVIKSALDKEFILKEAEKLNADGIECLVIPASATSPSNRLVLFSTEDLRQAQLKADSLRPSFGAGLWVLKY